MENKLDIPNILKDIDESRIEELRGSLDEFYPQDIAEQIKFIEREEVLTLFDILSYKQGAAVFIELEEHQIRSLLPDISDDRLIHFVNELELDDAADILGLLDDERLIQVENKLQRPIELKELLSFDPETCGGIMNPDFISVRADLKTNAALRFIKLKAKQIDSNIIYIYVTQKFGELAGVVSLKDLFLAPEDSLVREHMISDAIAVNVDEDQETAAELISKYHFLAIPVTNRSGQLVGVISIDDIVEIIEDEVTSDIYQSSGINVEFESVYSSPESILNGFFGAYRARTPWLVITLFGQILSASLIMKFSSVVSALPIAVSFMPLLSGLSGNIGNQSTTIIVRGISTGEVDADQSLKVLRNELLVSLGIGFTCASLAAGVSWLMNHNHLLASLIAISMIVSMFCAVFLGTITPIIFKKSDIDPASASGPLITTMIDIIAFVVYLSLLSLFVDKLL